MAAALANVSLKDVVANSHRLASETGAGDLGLARNLILTLVRDHEQSVPLEGAFDIERATCLRLTQDLTQLMDDGLFRVLAVSLTHGRAIALLRSLKGDDAIRRALGDGAGLLDSLDARYGVDIWQDLPEELLDGLMATAISPAIADEIERGSNPHAGLFCLLANIWWRTVVVVWTVAIPTADATSVADLVELEFVESARQPTVEQAVRLLEPFVQLVSKLLEDGTFQDVPDVERRITIDRNYLSDYLVENPDQLNMRIIVPLVRQIIGATMPVFPEGTDSDLVASLQAQEADRPLSAQDGVELADIVAKAIDSSKLGTRNRYEYVATSLGWSAGVGVSVAEVLSLLSMSGPAAVAVGAYAGIMCAAWRTRRRPSG